MVCQIDALQRLKGDSNIIRNALANLPKTLDETYERIFLEIPDQARLFVHHALKWIYSYGELHCKGITTGILLQLIQRSTSELLSSTNDYLYDEELLRELCGCLIALTPTPEHDINILAVSFAHYTVWEFLDSTRIRNSPVAFFAVDENSTNLEFTKVVMHEVLEPKLGFFYWEDSDISSYPPQHLFDENIYLSCAISSFFSVNCWTYHICQDDVRTSAFNLVNPSKPHFKIFTNIIEWANNHRPLFYYDGYPNTTSWNSLSESPKNNDTWTLFNMICANGSFELGRRFLETVNKQDVLRAPLKMKIDSLGRLTSSDTDYFEFQGSLMELFAQSSLIWRDHLDFILDLGVKYFDPSRIMFVLIGLRKRRAYDYDNNDVHFLSRLLQLGAPTAVPGCRIRPLQIAVAKWNYAAVEILLEAGADPNDTGDKNGLEWEEDDPLHIFNCLRGSSPLYILRELNWCHPDHPTADRQSSVPKIEAILLEHGARQFRTSETE